MGLHAFVAMPFGKKKTSTLTKSIASTLSQHLKVPASKSSELMKNSGQATSVPTCFKSCC